MGRWPTASADEGGTAGANSDVAMAAAANEVLQRLHLERAEETAAAFTAVLARWPDNPSKAAGQKLGAAIGQATVESRETDGFANVRYFRGDGCSGRAMTPRNFTNMACKRFRASISLVQGTRASPRTVRTRSEGTR